MTSVAKAERPGWTKRRHLGETDEPHTWECFPKKPGVYVLMREGRLSRIGGEDPEGILYVGKAKDLRKRLLDARRAKNHPATSYFGIFPRARMPILGATGIDQSLDNLEVRYASPIAPSDLGLAERVVLVAYVNRYAELPPLNSALPGRWERGIPKAWRDWGRRALSGSYG